MAPSATHHLGSSTKGFRALLSPMVLFPPHRKVLCQVPACWWREGLKCSPADQLLGSAPSRLVASPSSDTRSRSPTNNHHNCISLGRAMGLWVIAVGVRPTIITTAIHKSPQAVSHLLCVDQHRTTV